MKAAQGDEMAVKFHVPVARKLGAAKAEVVDAILMTLTVSGLRGLAACLPGAVSEFE